MDLSKGVARPSMHILQDHSDESSSLSGAKIRAVTRVPEFESRKTRSATTISVISLIPTVNHGAISVFAGRSVGRNSRRVGATPDDRPRIAPPFITVPVHPNHCWAPCDFATGFSELS